MKTGLMSKIIHINSIMMLLIITIKGRICMIIHQSTGLQVMMLNFVNNMVLDITDDGSESCEDDDNFLLIIIALKENVKQLKTCI